MASWMKSLQWRLQFWHAMILLAVILGFGAILNWEMTRSQWDSVDEELVSAARILEGALRLVPRPILESLSQDVGAPPGPTIPEDPRGQDGRGPRRPPHPAPRQGKAPPNRQLAPGASRLDRLRSMDWENVEGIQPIPDSAADWESRVSLPNALPQPLGRGQSQMFFVVWRKDDSILKQSAVFAPIDPPSPEIRSQLMQLRYLATQRGPFREVFLPGPHNTLLCVGRPVIEEENRNRLRVLISIAAGISIFAIGLGGGWWLSRTAIQPIEDMSKTASMISEKNLSQRMDVAAVDHELADLGTVLNTMLDRLEGAFQRQRQFTSDASHELRTPLASLMLSTELALSRSRSVDELRATLESNLASSQRMTGLVESLLMLARLDAGAQSMPMKELDLQSVLRNSIQSLESEVKERSVRVMDETVSMKMIGHEVNLERVFTNIIGNAIRHGKESGQVSIRNRITGDYVIVSVEDNGPGIEQQHLEKLFDPFFRVDSSRSNHIGGYGLGLSIAKRIVLLHGGNIQVTSVMNHGSKFEVHLPQNPPKVDTSR